MNTRSRQAWPVGLQTYEIEEVDAAEIIDEPADELWQVQVAAGDVRTVTLDKLDDLYRYDVIDEQAFVWQTGMTQWVRLSTLLGVEATEPEEPFHVLLGPGNVKQLSLEQLDDFYRIEVIDENTLIWQKGMTEWQALGKLAGIDAATSVELPTTPQHQIATQRFNPPVPRVAPVAFVAPVLSAPPVAFTIEPLPQASVGGAGRWLIRLALAAGVILALLRNDLAYSMVGQTALASRYAELETSLLGGPSFGTERSVERLVADCGGPLEPVRLPVAVTQFADAQKSLAARTKAETNAKPLPSESPKSTAAAVSSVAGTPAAPASAPASAQVPNAKAASAAPMSQNVAAALGGLPVKSSAPSAKAASSARPAKSRATKSKGQLRSGGSYFDPLNPTL